MIESPTFQKGDKFEVNAGGYVHSQRVTQDGCVYMGTATQNEATGKFINDIVVPPEEVGMGSVHMIIQFNVEKQCYFIRDCGQGTGTFVKIEQALTLKQGFIISYGDSHMYVNFDSKEKLQLKFLDGPKSDQMLYPLIMLKPR